MTENEITVNVKNFVSNLGYLPLDIVVKRRKNFYEISFAIFKKSGVTVRDCERVTLFVKDFLTMMLKEDFSLNVSSPGAERVLKSVEELDIFVYSKAKVILKNGSVLSGIIRGTGEERKVLLLEGLDSNELSRIEIDNIAKCKLTL